MKKTNSNSRLSRRSFIGRTAVGTAAIAITPVSSVFANLNNPSNWPANAEDITFHMIGHAHIDPVWLWPWQEGISIVHSSFRSALDRMNETPGVEFISSSAQFYEWVAENDPEMLEQIKKRLDEGRWNIVGGWWIEPDVNIPGGEAFVRQGLYGQNTFQKLFGKKAKVAFNPDSFGHTSTLPQILKKQEMDYYVFMRPGPHEKTIPADLFKWQGLDGTQITTYRIPFSYNDSNSVRKRTEDVLERFQGQPMKNYMSFYGVGDHGGGPTKANISSILEMQSEKGAPKIVFSTPEQYFAAIEKENPQMPVVNDDLQHHAVGCYTAEAEIKKGNRQSEALLITAEKIAAIGSAAWGAAYPKKDFTTAWQRVLFLQFHDSLAGTSVPEHSQAAREGYGFAQDIAHQAMYKAIQKLEWQIASEDPGSEYFVAFNPHAWEVSEIIEYDFNWGTQHKGSRVEDENGNPLAHQWAAGTTETGSRKKLLTEVNIPAMGYCQVRLMDGNSPAISNPVNASGDILENEMLKVRFNKNGTLEITDKTTGKKVFTTANGCRAVVIDDKSDTWSHDIKAFDDEIGEFGNAKIVVLENGPLRAKTRVTTSWGDSKLTIDWTLRKGSPNLEAAVTLDWHEKLKMLKFSFPVNVDSSVATYETSYGNIVRTANGDEDPGQRWIDVTGKQDGSSYGLAVINDAKYGYSIKGNDMRISVMRSAVYAHHNPRVLDMEQEHLWMDQGIHTFKMLLVPHKDSWKEAGVVQLAEILVAPPIPIYQGIHGGKLPKSGSFLSTDKRNIVVSAVKLAEDNNDIIIRSVETEGIKTEAKLDLAFAGTQWSGSFNPYEIKTLRISKGKVRQVNLLEE
ncbi:alpha-mannosidase [Draconibacterium sp.]|jgi:alpha-mannosidase